MREKVVLAYSGGLDTSVAIRWLQENYGMDVITLTADVGNEKDIVAIRDKALRVGAIKAAIVDARDLFVHYFVFPALQAGAVYEGEYPLATALARPLIAKLLVDLAKQEGATAVAHGCTGKGNDQVRFDLSIGALAPDIKVIAPVREWGMTRDEEIVYAEKHDIPIPITAASPYSIDQNIWGRSIECGILEDPWLEPPEDAFMWTKSVKDTSDEPRYVEIEFDKGIPVAMDGETLDGVTLITRLGVLAGEHGVGRIDHVENRVVGIKSREIYEAPAAVVLLKAHQALEDMTLSKDQARFKQKVSLEYADMIYGGLWFSSLHQDLAAYIQSSQRFVTGTIRVRLHKGTCQVVGRRAPKALYNRALATYDKGDQFDHSAAIGFIKLWGLQLRTQAQVQLLESKDAPSILPPRVEGLDEKESL
ncbi:MAG: argininosuccinate synthase [Chloroflexota bacterium]|nr:MAG: argininosuccinate synthase [Chloroflexota bacterium]